MNEPTLLELLDGSVFTVRPMHPGDTDTVVEGFRHLSPESIFRRFFSPVPALLDDHRLADLVGLRPGHQVLLAFDADGRLAGGVRAIADPDDPGAAELAVTVADAWQHHGLGRQLLRLLVRELRAQGVERIRGHVLGHNHAAKALVAPGASWWHDGDGVVGFEVPIRTPATV